MTPWQQRLMIGGVLGLTVLACKQKPERVRSVIAPAETAELLDNSQPPVFRRDVADVSIGLLEFATLAPASCRVVYWQKGQEQKTATYDCQAQQHTRFQERITGLSEELYEFKVFIWPAEQQLDPERYFVMREKSAESPPPPNAPEQTLEYLAVARMVMPQFVTQIHYHKLNQALSVDKLRAQLVPQQGCAEGKPKLPNPLAQAVATSPLRDVASAGFGSGAALAHPRYQHVLQQNFEDIQTQVNWDWSYVVNDFHHQFTSYPPAYFREVFIQSKAGEIKLETKSRKLNTTSAVFEIEAGQDWGLSWKTRYRPSASFVLVQISKSEQVIHCFFAANDKAPQVPSELLGKLGKGVMDVSVALQGSQVFVRKDSEFLPWLIRSHDWRYFQLRI